MPPVFVETGIDSADTNLRAETVADFVDQLRATDGSAVDAHLVSTGIEQTLHICQFVHTASHREGDINLTGHPSHHLGKGLATLKAGRNVQETKFVGPLFTIGLTQFYRVARTAQVDEVGAFDGLAVLDVQAGYDAFCQSSHNS